MDGDVTREYGYHQFQTREAVGIISTLDPVRLAAIVTEGVSVGQLDSTCINASVVA